MKVKEFMITDVIYIQKDARIVDLLKLLVNNKIGGVPVVEDNQKFVTMLSDGDVLRFLKPQDRTIYDMLTLIMISEKEDLEEKLHSSMLLPVERIIKKKKLFTLKPEDDLEEAIAILSQHKFKKIPVINDENQVIGVISRGDVIRYIATKLIMDEGMEEPDKSKK